MGSGLVRYKAEVDFDGRELTRSYLDKQDLETMLEEVKNLRNINEMEAFMLKHGENIGLFIFTAVFKTFITLIFLVDLLGAEIDRIESALRVKSILFDCILQKFKFSLISEKTSRSASLRLGAPLTKSG